MNSKVDRALHLAKDIMDYCRGDAWERECTEKERAEFNSLYDEFFPQPIVKETLHDYDRKCDVCGIIMPKGNLPSHLNGKRHKKELNKFFNTPTTTED